MAAKKKTKKKAPAKKKKPAPIAQKNKKKKKPAPVAKKKKKPAPVAKKKPTPAKKKHTSAKNRLARKAKAVTKTDFASRLQEALMLQHSGDNEGAVRAFVALSDELPDDARLADNAGNIFLYALERPTEAIACYERAMPHVDDPTELCHKIGFAHAMAGDDASASVWFAKAHEHTPTHATTFLEVAKLCMRAGRFQDALEYLDTAWAHHVMGNMLSGGPQPHFRALVLMNQARVRLRHLDKVEEGIAGFRAVIDEMHDYQRGRTLAAELIEAGKLSAAARVLDLVLAVQPLDEETLTLRRSIAA